jgi:hypothetical protein
MKAAKIILVVLFTAALVQGAKLGYSYFLPQIIPLCHGYKPGIYDLIGIVMILLFLYALRYRGRRRRRGRRRTKASYPYDQVSRQDMTNTYGRRNRYQ